jgi:signal peptidase I
MAETQVRRGEFAALLAVAALLLLLLCSPWHPAAVAGTSMEPTITRNDLVMIAPVDAGDLAVGDIIAFRPQEDDMVPIAHRIVSIDGDGTIRTRCDNAAMPDPYAVRSEQVAGRIALIIPHAGAAMRVVHSTAGYAALILIPGLLIVAHEIRRMRRCERQ